MKDIKKRTISFGIIADCQYADENDESYRIPAEVPLVYNCSYRQVPRRLEEAIRLFNTEALDFVVHLGDFVDRRIEEFFTLDDITQLSNTPFWHVIGNHEYKDKSNPIEKVVSLYRMPGRYYTKELYNYKFIIVDSNEEGVIAHREGSKEWVNGAKLIASME